MLEHSDEEVLHVDQGKKFVLCPFCGHKHALKKGAPIDEKIQKCTCSARWTITVEPSDLGLDPDELEIKFAEEPVGEFADRESDYVEPIYAVFWKEKGVVKQYP